MTVDIKSLENLTEEKQCSDTLVKNFMERNVLTVKEDYSIKSCIEFLRINKISGAPVVDEHNNLIGVVSEFDLLIQASTGTDLNSNIKYNKDPIWVLEEDTLKLALVKILKNKIKRLPVINKRKKIVGVVSRIDLLDKIAKC